MRLGACPCILKKGSLARKLYNTEEISERHRHRFEVNNEYRETLEQHGLVFSGLSPDKKLVEIIELRDHPWFVGVQFHPEFKSTPRKPHPLFCGFIASGMEHRDHRLGVTPAASSKRESVSTGHGSPSGNSSQMTINDFIKPPLSSPT